MEPTRSSETSESQNVLPQNSPKKPPQWTLKKMLLIAGGASIALGLGYSYYKDYKEEELKRIALEKIERERREYERKYCTGCGGG